MQVCIYRGNIYSNDSLHQVGSSYSLKTITWRQLEPLNSLYVWMWEQMVVCLHAAPRWAGDLSRVSLCFHPLRDFNDLHDLYDPETMKKI